MVDYLPSPLDIPPVTGHRPRDRQARGARRPPTTAPFAALAFKIMNDQYVGPARLPARVLGHARGRLRRLQLDQGQEGARRPPAADARQQARGDRGGRGRRHRGGGRPQATHHRRHAVRRRQAGRARVDGLPGAGHRGGHRAQDQGRRGEARRCRWPAGPGRPDVPGHTDEETGQTLIHGMGELHLEIIVDRLLREFKVEANVGKPQVAYRETIRQQGRGAGASSSGRPAVAASTATCGSRSSRSEPGERLRVREQDRGRRRSRASTCPRSRRASRRRMRDRRAGRLSRWSTSRWR